MTKMIEEKDIEIAQRYLVVTGKVLLKVKRDLNIPNKLLNEDFFFVMYSYADIPKDKVFTYVYNDSAPKQYEKVELSVDYITQQFGKEFSEIYHGWKVICNFKLKSGKPKLLDMLPHIDDWFSSKDTVCICNEETYKLKC